MWYLNWSTTSAETPSGGVFSGMQGRYGLGMCMVCFVVMFVTADAFLLLFFSFTRSGEKLCHVRAVDWNSELRLMPCSPSNTRSRSCGQSSMIIPLFHHEPTKASRRLQISDMSYVIDHLLPLLQVIGNVMR